MRKHRGKHYYNRGSSKVLQSIKGDGVGKEKMNVRVSIRNIGNMAFLKIVFAIFVSLTMLDIFKSIMKIVIKL